MDDFGATKLLGDTGAAMSDTMMDTKTMRDFARQLMAGGIIDTDTLAKGLVNTANAIDRMTGTPFNAAVPECDHEWVSGDNSMVSNAAVCRLCWALVPADTVELGDRPSVTKVF